MLVACDRQERKTESAGRPGSEKSFLGQGRNCHSGGLKKREALRAPQDKGGHFRSCHDDRSSKSELGFSSGPPLPPRKVLKASHVASTTVRPALPFLFTSPWPVGQVALASTARSGAPARPRPERCLPGRLRARRPRQPPRREPPCLIPFRGRAAPHGSFVCVGKRTRPFASAWPAR